MANASPFASAVAESALSYLACKSHGIWVNAHLALGTHRLEEPVSNTTWNDWGGVPSEMAPKYCASMKLVMGTDAAALARSPS